MCRLLALMVGGMGGSGLADYEPPSVQLAELLAEPPEAEVTALERGEIRRQQVAAFVSAMGGEVG